MHCNHVQSVPCPIESRKRIEARLDKKDRVWFLVSIASILVSVCAFCFFAFDFISAKDQASRFSAIGYMLCIIGSIAISIVAINLKNKVRADKIGDYTPAMAEALEIAENSKSAAQYYKEQIIEGHGRMRLIDLDAMRCRLIAERAHNIQDHWQSQGGALVGSDEIGHPGQSKANTHSTFSQ